MLEDVEEMKEIKELLRKKIAVQVAIFAMQVVILLVLLVVIAELE